HLVATQRGLAADRPTITDLERCHRDTRLGDDRLLARDLGHVADGVFQDLLVGGRFTDTQVQGDFDQLRHLHGIGVTELLHQRRHHFFLVKLFETGSHLLIPQASSASPLERNTRSLRPSSSTLKPTRSPLPEAGLSTFTLEIWIDASRSTTPPATPACGFGLVWRLTMFTLATTRRSPSTRTTSPCLPLSLPALTTTWSPFLIRLAMIISCRSQHFGSERDDLHELLRTKFTSHRPEDTGPDRLLLVVKQNGGVAVEADQRAVGATHTLAGTHHDGVIHFTLLDLAARNRILHGDL